MGLLIKFPYPRKDSASNPQLKNQKELTNSVILQNTTVSDYRDEEQGQAFFNLVKEWPCCNSLNSQLNLESILEMYYDDELTTQQDYVLEYLFHMHDPKSSFDIANALYSWSENDRNFFILSLNLHAEIIDQIKKKEY